MFSLHAIREGLAETRSAPAAEGAAGDAAVALVLSGTAEALELCLIRRAARDGDRWSGQLAFPGGRAERGDRDMRATAERETAEEVGLDLSHAEFLGGLDSQPIHPSRGPEPARLWPFAYYLGEAQVALQPEQREVDRAFWTRLGVLGQPERRTELSWNGIAFPGIRLGDDVLWGLTLRVCERLCDTLGAPLELVWPWTG